MSLSAQWEKLKFKLAAWDIYTPAAVQQDMEKQGWEFDCLFTGVGPAPVITIIRSPEGKALGGNKDVFRQYHEARRNAVKKVFGIS